MHFTDEHLNKLIDGELSTAEENELRAALAYDELLAERYAALALIDVRLKESFSAIDDVPIPESILSLLTDDQNHRKEHSGETQDIRTFWQRLGGVMAKPVTFHPAAAMAFTFTMFGLVTLYIWQPFEKDQTVAAIDPARATEYGVLESANPVAKILSNAPSGSAQQVPGNTDIEVVPVLSFASSTGDFCREYTLNSKASSHRAVACKQNNAWRVVLSTMTQDLQNPDHYQTASAITPSEFERKIDEIIHGDPLSFQQELLLIEQEWLTDDESQK